MRTWLKGGCLGLCYLAFAGSLSRAEGVAAALTGAFAALVSLGLEAKAEAPLDLRGRWVAAAAQVAAQMARDIGRVAATLVLVLFRGRGHRGPVALERQAAERPLGCGSGHRAATALLASVTPDSVALETGDEAFPVHRLSRRTEPAREAGRSR